MKYINKEDLKNSYPARPHSILIGRIVEREFEHKSGIKLPNQFKYMISTEGHKLVQDRNGGLIFTIDMFIEILVLNYRAGVLEMDEIGVTIVFKWIEKNRPDLLK